MHHDTAPSMPCIMKRPTQYTMHAGEGELMDDAARIITICSGTLACGGKVPSLSGTPQDELLSVYTWCQ